MDRREKDWNDETYPECVAPSEKIVSRWVSLVDRLDREVGDLVNDG